MIVWLAIRIKQYKTEQNKTKQKAVMINIDKMSIYLKLIHRQTQEFFLWDYEKGFLRYNQTDALHLGGFCIYAERLEKADWDCNLFTSLDISIWLTLFIKSPPPQANNFWVAISIKYTWKQYPIVFSNCVKIPNRLRKTFLIH